MKNSSKTDEYSLDLIENSKFSKNGGQVAEIFLE